MSTVPAPVVEVPHVRAVAAPSVWGAPRLHPDVEAVLLTLPASVGVSLIVRVIPGAGWLGNPAERLPLPLTDDAAAMLTLFLPPMRQPGGDTIYDRRVAWLRYAVDALRYGASISDIRDALRACVAAGIRTEAELLSACQRGEWYR